MIEVEGLTQRYGAYTAVRELSFALEPGEVVGFLGPNGAGKSTTLKVLASYLAPSQGSVRVGGHCVLREPLRVRETLGYLPEHCPLYEDMSVAGFLDYVGRVRGIPRRERRAARARVVGLCQLEEVEARGVNTLSKGFRQRVGIAHALLHDPPVLILDEPTSGLDPNQVLEVRGLVKELGRARTVLFSSHVLSEVEATCERVVVIHQGRLVADDTLVALRQRVSGGALCVECEAPAAEWLEELSGVEGVAEARPWGRGAEVLPAEGVEDLPQRLFRWACQGERTLVRLAPRAVTLEDVFARLTGARAAEGQA